MTLRQRLQREFPAAKQQTLKRMVEARRVRINGRIARRLSEVIEPSDAVTIAATKQWPPHKAHASLDIVYEDRDLLVINKPAGLLTSTGVRDTRQTAIAAVRQYLAATDPQARGGLIHRLDRDASGLLVLSKNRLAFESLKKQFFHHTVTRIYHAVVSPPPKKNSARIESILAERADGTVYSTSIPGQGKRAITTFDVAKRRGTFALVRIKLHTGRKHQIRAQFSELGSPIVGDTNYGGKPLKSHLLLEAVELAFEHPRSGKKLKFALPQSSDRVIAAFEAIGPERNSS